MAIAIRGTTPGLSVVTSNPVSVVLNGTRQPQAGDVLLIIHCNDFYALTNMPTPTVGGSTTGVTAVTGGTADAGSNLAHIKSYTYVVGSSGDLTVAVTETGSADEEKALAVYVLSGVDTTTPVDGSAAGSSGTSSTSWVCPAVSPSTSDAFLVCHGNSGGGAAAGSHTWTITEQYDTLFGGINVTGATEQLAASGSTGTRTATGTNSLAYASLSVPMMTAAGGGGGGSAWTYGYDVRIG